jgi:hypothetical protein
LGVLSCLAAGTAHATVRVVTSTTDDVNDVGSLRHMIQIADPYDIITFDLQYPAVIALSGVLNPDTPPLSVQKSLTISGPGADKLTVQAYADFVGGGGVRYDAFEIYQPDVPDSDVSVAISGLAIENASGAIYSDNFTNASKPFQTYLTVSDVVIRCAFAGTGVWVRAGTIAQVIRTTISGDHSEAVFAESFAPNPPSFVTVADSTFSNETGALEAQNSAIAVTNSTFVNAPVLSELNSTITLVFTTILGAPATLSPSIRVLDASAAVVLQNSLLAGNPVGNCAGSASIASADYNLSDDASCNLGAAHDINNVPAGLDPHGLAWNGGPTQTIWLLPGSPALNAVPIANCIDLDQRGVARLPGVACDIGALESDGIFAANFE